MSSDYDPTALPERLPLPVDDGRADHIPGLRLPSLRFPATSGGSLDLGELAAGLLALFVYPRTGRPGEEPPRGWDEIPGARGCTPQSCGFRDLRGEFESLGCRIAGLSSQTAEHQLEAAERLRLGYPLLADPDFRLAAALDLPTFTFDGERLYSRLALVARAGEIVEVFYPVFPPDRNAAEVLAWLRAAT